MNVWENINEIYAFNRLYSLSYTVVKIQSKLNSEQFPFKTFSQLLQFLFRKMSPIRSEYKESQGNIKFQHEEVYSKMKYSF